MPEKTDRVRITETSHPRLHEVCLTIRHDMGAAGRGTPTESVVAFSLPLSHVDAAFANSLLGRLSVEERQTFAIGEASDADEIAERYHLNVLHDALNDWVDEGVGLEGCA